MVIYYQTKSVQKLFEKEKKLAKKIGYKSTEIVRNRLAFIRASRCLAGLYKVPGGLHPLKGDRKGQYALNLDGGKRLVFSVEYEGTQIDEQSIEEVTIVGVIDYHH